MPHEMPDLLLHQDAVAERRDSGPQKEQQIMRRPALPENLAEFEMLATRSHKGFKDRTKWPRSFHKVAFRLGLHVVLCSFQTSGTLRAIWGLPLLWHRDVMGCHMLHAFQ